MSVNFCPLTCCTLKFCPDIWPETCVVDCFHGLRSMFKCCCAGGGEQTPPSPIHDSGQTPPSTIAVPDVTSSISVAGTQDSPSWEHPANSGLIIKQSDNSEGSYNNEHTVENIGVALASSVARNSGVIVTQSRNKGGSYNNKATVKNEAG